ncbi:MAG: glycosyltransferase family 9 protein [Deltaproteobacteria bacterium]|jgi:heptosyltransferase-2|nr:glycosyltransferase family 9 protein [Deltaproteobacteria bacterium]
MKHPALLIRGVNWLGDAVMSLPALRRLMEGRDAVIVARNAGYQLYKAFFGDSLPVLEDVKGFKRRLSLIRTLTGFPLEKAYLLQNSFGAALIALLSGVKERIGYARDARGPLLTGKFKPSPNFLNAHEVFYYLNISAPPGAPLPEYSYPSVPEDLTGDKVSLEGVHEDLPDALKADLVLACAPGAKFGGAKKAPLELYARALDLVLEERGGGSVLILGGAEERGDAAALRGMIKKGRALDLSGRTSVRQITKTLSRTTLLLTNDSGLMHLGAALNIKVLAFFGPTSPITTGPASPGNALVLRSKPPCAPCFKGECPLKNRVCFNGVSPEEALEKASRLLEPKSILPEKRAGIIYAPSPPPELSALPECRDILPLPSAAPGDLEELLSREFLDPAFTVLIADDLETLKKLNSRVGHTVLSLGEKVPENLVQDGFLPHMTAPTPGFALAYARELVRRLLSAS